MMNKSTHLLELIQEWRRLARLTTMEEVRETCLHYSGQASADLRFWREAHHRHILAVSPENEDGFLIQ